MAAYVAMMSARELKFVSRFVQFKSKCSNIMKGRTGIDQQLQKDEELKMRNMEHHDVNKKIAQTEPPFGLTSNLAGVLLRTQGSVNWIVQFIGSTFLPGPLISEDGENTDSPLRPRRNSNPTLPPNM